MYREKLFFCLVNEALLLPKRKSRQKESSGGSADLPTDVVPWLCVPRSPEVCSDQKYKLQFARNHFASQWYQDLGSRNVRD